jgi:tetratricopeptide (TPR) repeat protein
VAVIAVLPFVPALSAEFVHWDDDVNFVNNPHFRGLGARQIGWMLSTTLLGHWIPLTWLTLGANYVVGGMDPRGYHLVNVLLHAMNAGLLWLIARRLIVAAADPAVPAGAAATGATVAALVFAVHPLRAESVAWVSQRRDVLSAALYLLAVLAYLGGTARGGVLRGGPRVVSATLLAAALCSKAMVMTLPLTLLVLDAYPLRRLGLGWRALLREKLPHLVLAGAGAVIAALAVSRGGTWTDYGTYSPTARIAMAAYSFWFYPWKLVWPEGLVALYELPVRVDPWSRRFLVPMLGLAVVTLALLALRRRLPGMLAAWVHSAIVIVPVSGLVHAGYQLAHDRYSYLSGLGFAVLAGGGVSWAAAGRLRGWVRTAVVVASGLALVGLAAGTWRQSQTWRDSETLWRHAVETDGHCAICRNNLAGALIVRRPGDPAALAEAEAHLYQAIALRPGYTDPYQSLGALYMIEGRAPEAETVFLALARTFPTRPEGPARLAGLYAAQGRPDAAIAELREALRRRPSFEPARRELARLLAAEPHAPGADLERRR